MRETGVRYIRNGEFGVGKDPESLLHCQMASCEAAHRELFATSGIVETVRSGSVDATMRLEERSFFLNTSGYLHCSAGNARISVADRSGVYLVAAVNARKFDGRQDGK